MSSYLDQDQEEEVQRNAAVSVMESPPAVDSSLQIWSICLSRADKFDRALVATWKGDMDGILIFSGLFSAVVTTFLISTYPALQPDVSVINANLTAQVATILARSTNQSGPVTPQLPSPNSYTAYLIINAFWFLSLAFSLICALLAILVQQWSRTYLQGTEERFNLHQRVRMRTYLQRGVQKFYFVELVGTIPVLLHIALFLFFCGLVVFLFNIDTTLAHIMLAFSILALVMYILLTSLPVFFHDCPYKTPLTFVLSYITYACHPSMWAQGGREHGAELDHTALRWTLLALTDPNDLELFVKALQGLLQSNSGTSLSRDGGRAVQALLFGPDMLATKVVQLLHSVIPSEMLALAPADRQRLETRAATCLSTVSLLARACSGPAPSAYHLWGAWAFSYSNPVMREVLAMCKHPQPALATLAHSTAFFLAWRALVAYRAFLADICQCAKNAQKAAHAEQYRLRSDICDRLPAGVYLVRAMRDALHGLTGDPAAGIGGGALLAQQAEGLASGALSAYMPGVNPRAPGTGGFGAGVNAGGVMDSSMQALAKAAQADMIKAKTCLAVLFMYAACALPADAAGREALQALAAPLGWSDSCEYDEGSKALRLLLDVRFAHGEDTLTVFDADRVVELYHSIHNMGPSDVNSFSESPNIQIRPRRWRQGTL